MKYSNIFSAKVGDNGRITIPKAISDSYRIKRGDIVTFAVLEITKITDIKIVNIASKDIDKNAGDYEEILKEMEVIQ